MRASDPHPSESNPENSTADTAQPAVDLCLRPAASADRDFLLQVYASTRQEELQLVDWSPDQKQAFITMQFEAQHRYYHENYTGASYDIILVDGEPAGRLYIARWPGEIRIIDIALLPAFRGRGTGTRLLKQILAEAERTGCRVSIHVEKFNPAQRLYARLGFRPVDDRGVYIRMDWTGEKAGE